MMAERFPIRTAQTHPGPLVLDQCPVDQTSEGLGRVTFGNRHLSSWHLENLINTGNYPRAYIPRPFFVYPCDTGG